MLLVLALSLGCGLGDTSRVTDVMELKGDSAAGEKLYAELCSECHGESGEGGEGPPMDEIMYDNSDNQFVWYLLFTDHESHAEGLTDQELADLTAYARAAFDG